MANDIFGIGSAAGSEYCYISHYQYIVKCCAKNIVKKFEFDAKVKEKSYTFAKDSG
jgi:hypothetical protein